MANKNEIQISFQFHESYYLLCLYSGISFAALTTKNQKNAANEHRTERRNKETKKTSTPQVANMCTKWLHTCGVNVCTYARVALDETYGSRNIRHKATGTRLFTVSLTGGIVQIFRNNHNKSSGPGSVVGIANGYGLDGPGIESR